MTVTIDDLQADLRQFARDRDWDQFHTPKNLAMALAGEVGELTELFQWLTPAQSADVMADDKRAEDVRHELADVFAYLLRLADVLHVDLETALRDKLTVNAQRYPVEEVRGRAVKYTELGADQ